MVPDIGRLLWKIRDKINTQLSVPIIELILLPKVEFLPIDSKDDRPISDADIGFKTSIWAKL